MKSQKSKLDRRPGSGRSDYRDGIFEYADHGEILTDVKSPGHIVRKQGGRPVMDLKVKTFDANNPYLVFPVPPNVKMPVAQ